MKTVPEESGISRANRQLLKLIHRHTDHPFTVEEAARFLPLEVPRVRRFLSYLASRGWLNRIRRGLYAVVSLEAEHPGAWSQDPWIVASRVFNPCFIAGWSACEYWDLTEQIFRSIVVFTTSPVRHRTQTIQGTEYVIKVVKPSKFFGLQPVWRERAMVQVSDPHRTVVDMLDDPKIGAGIRNVSDVLQNYFDGEHRDTSKLLEYMDKLGSGAVYKRLGYLLEALGIDMPDLLAQCLSRKTQGLVFLDPAVKKAGIISKRWNLRLNVHIERPAE